MTPSCGSMPNISLMRATRKTSHSGVSGCSGGSGGGARTKVDLSMKGSVQGSLGLIALPGLIPVAEDIWATALLTSPTILVFRFRKASLPVFFHISAGRYPSGIRGSWSLLTRILLPSTGTARKFRARELCPEATSSLSSVDPGNCQGNNDSHDGRRRDSQADRLEGIHLPPTPHRGRRRKDRLVLVVPVVPLLLP